MENHPQFSLNENLRRWRQNLEQTETLGREQLEELETHLLDAIAAWQAKGLTEEEAFLIAARRLGCREALDREFGKVNAGTAWHSRALWMIGGVFLFCLALNAAHFFASLVSLGGSTFALNGYTLGWMGLAARLAVVAGLFLVSRRLLKRKPAGLGVWRDRCARSPALTAVLASLLVLGSQAVSWVVAIFLARQIGPRELGMVFVLDGWGGGVISVLLTLVLSVAFARLIVLSAAKAKAHHGAFLLVMALGAMLTAGCGQANPGISAKTEASAAKGSQTLLEQAITLWTSGDTEGAVGKFLQMDWAKDRPFSDGSVLGYSERQFAALPAEARTKLSESMLADINVLKQLCTQMKQTGQDAAAKGDQAKAAKIFSAIRQCGERLDQPDGLAVLKLVGKAFQKLAAKEVEAGSAK